ncbi:hypothetical protein [Candidatus Harpocratesius sp.]
MAPQKRKKMSLEEARALFNDSPKNTNKKKGKRNFRESSKRRSKFHHSVNVAQIDKKIAILERRMMEGSLSAEEEQKILHEIEQLEKQKSNL